MIEDEGFVFEINIPIIKIIYTIMSVQLFQAEDNL